MRANATFIQTGSISAASIRTFLFLRGSISFGQSSNVINNIYHSLPLPVSKFQKPCSQSPPLWNHQEFSPQRQKAGGAILKWKENQSDLKWWEIHSGLPDPAQLEYKTHLIQLKNSPSRCLARNSAHTDFISKDKTTFINKVSAHTAVIARTDSWTLTITECKPDGWQAATSSRRTNVNPKYLQPGLNRDHSSPFS